MKTFPMFLKMAGRRIVIIGGGEQAAQKARLATKTEAELVLVAPVLDPELTDLVNEGKAQRIEPDAPDLFDNAALVFVATGCKGADAAWHAIAKRAGALVNVVDYPELCDAMTPSIVDRDPVVIAIGTEGTAPVLGRRLKTRIEEMLHPRLGAFAALAGRLRAEVAFRVSGSERRAFWRWVFGGAPWSVFASGNEREAADTIKTAIRTQSFADPMGRLSLVSGATAPDLIPVGTVARLQEADTIYADADVPAAVLELARRDAMRVQIPSIGSDPAALDKMLEEAASPAEIVCLSSRSISLDVPAAPGVIVDHMHCAVQVPLGGSAHLRLVSNDQT